MKVLFLDIDGVLNGHEWDDVAESCTIRRECVQRLNRVVQETGCRIVISSAWRYMIHGGSMTLEGFGHMMRTHGLIAGRNVIASLTRKDDPFDKEPGERARQIMEWASWFAVASFVAVDDIDHEFATHGVPAVITDGGTGLTDADADKLIEMLGRTEPQP